MFTGGTGLLTMAKSPAGGEAFQEEQLSFSLSEAGFWRHGFGRLWVTRGFAGHLGSPVVPFGPFLGEGSPIKIDYRKKGTLILTFLLEDLVMLFPN